jgi:hypothetical protein
MTTAKGGQPIGKRIRQVCAAVEQGACSSLDVAADINLPSKEVARYALRAEKHGLMMIERRTWPYTYRVLDGWRDLLEASKTPREAPEEVWPVRVAPVRVAPLPANSVFQWAGV